MNTRSQHVIGVILVCLVMLPACSQSSTGEFTPTPDFTHPPAFTLIPSPTPRPRGSLSTPIASTVTLTTLPGIEATLPAEPTLTLAAPILYTVVEGDTLADIAARFNTTVEAIKALNNLINDVVFTGQVLLIPSGYGSQEVDILDEDYFSNGEHYWLGVYSTSRVSIKDGKLVLNSNPGSYIAGAYCENCGPYQGDYFFEADIAIQKESDAGYGLIFGYINPDDYWTLIISPGTDSYAVYRMIDGEWQTKIEMTSTGDLQPFPKVNKIGVSFNSRTIDVYLNGQRQIDAIVNQSYPPGKVGFYSNYGYILLTATHMVVYKENPYP